MNILEKIKEKQKNLNACAPVTIAFFGDSVTQGCFELYKTSENSFQTEFRVEDGYHTKLREILQLLYPSVPINMIFGGISGGNAEQGLKRVERDICAFNPDLTIVCFGLNDCCAGERGFETYKECIRGIFKKLKACGSEIIFMTPNPIADYVSPEVVDEHMRAVFANIVEWGGSFLGMYLESAKEICKEENITVCDCHKIWQTLKDNDVNVTRLLSNRINHPVEKMNWLFAFKLAETIFSE